MDTSTNSGNNSPDSGAILASSATGTVSAPKKQTDLAKIAIILFLLLLTAIAFFLIYTFIKQPVRQTGSPGLTPAATTAKPTPSVPPVSGTPMISTFPQSAWVGKYLRTVLPTGWTIEEYENGKGTTSLAEGLNYRGLTGFAVINNTGAKVFTAEAVSGVGGIGCEKIYRFADTEQQYVDGLVETNKEVDIAGSIVDLSAKNYFAYNFFGTPARRVLTTMYYDVETEKKPQFFNPACGLNSFVPPLASGPYFESSTSASAPVWAKESGYQFAIKENTDNNDLLKLDEVLKNLGTVKFVF